MTNYVKISKSEFEIGLSNIVSIQNELTGFQEKNIAGIEEHVYVIKTKNPLADIKVYSSISKRSNISRTIGSDAIRCVIEYKGKEIYKGTAHTKRIATWERNLASKIESLTGEVSQLKMCPKCASVMTLRKGPKGHFFGCSSFPKCRHTISK